MKYITGIHALNLPCSLETCGDWHTSAIQWKELSLRESDDSIFKDYGIELCHHVPENEGDFYIADTLRALLDLLDDGNFGLAQGANNDFICNDAYTDEFFEHVYMLRDREHLGSIDKFMKREYLFRWDEFLDSKGEYVEWMHRERKKGVL